MNHASLFSGIGGFDVAAQWMGWDNVFHCEWNPFGQRVLKYHFPKSISYNDITETDFSIHRGTIDVLTGGFPCQPYSVAGKRLGKADERHLFPEMLRVIKEVQPTFVVGENVRGLVSWNGGLVFHEVCSDLESQGYEVQPFIIPAASVNAPHRRDRVWFVAYSNDKRRGTGFRKVQGQDGEVSQRYDDAKPGYSGSIITPDTFGIRLEHGSQGRDIPGSKGSSQSKGSQLTEPIEANGEARYVTDTEGARIERQRIERQRQIQLNGRDSENIRAKFEDFPTKPPICGGDDGLPRELDSITFSKWRMESIKAYGNAIVPQVAYNIFKAIDLFTKQENQ